MSYNKTKTDPELGQRVHEHLVKMGVETPTNPNNYDRKEKIDHIEAHFAHIMRILGLDLSDDSLIDTPKRVAKMYVNEIFWGLDYEAFQLNFSVNRFSILSLLSILSDVSMDFAKSSTTLCISVK